MPPAHSCTRSARPGATGAGEKLHMPTTSVVTPWRTLDSADGHLSYTRSECEWMSMNPGVTISPLASITRSASPVSPGPTAAMRSPSTATSAARAGAPLPSTTVPFRIRSDQGMTLLVDLDDLHRLHLVADLDLVHQLHAGGHSPEDGVLAVEEVGRGQRDVELAARRVRGLGARHREHAADVLLLVELVLDRVAGAPGAVALGITPLDHEVRLDAVERHAVVEALLGQGHEVLHRLGGILGKELERDLAALLHGDDGRLFHLLASFGGFLGCGWGRLLGADVPDRAGQHGCHEQRDERDDGDASLHE